MVKSLKKAIYFFSTLFFIGGLTFYYSSRPNVYDVRFPIDFVPGIGFPRTLVKIEGKPYRFFIDTGSSSCLSLEKELLDQIQEKQFLQNYITTNVGGEIYPVKAYRIPLVKIWYLEIKNPEIIEASPGTTVCKLPGIIAKPSLEQQPGHIGRAVISSMNWFMDFHNAAMFACGQLADRKKDGYCLDKLLQVPFELDSLQGYILKAETDLGIKRFMLDTGSGHNLIKTSLLKDKTLKDWIPGKQRYHSSKFVMNGRDFGSTAFVPFELSSFFENLDGILGMEFFNEYIVYLDFEKKIAHIGKSTECLGEEDLVKLKNYDFHLPDGITLNN